MKKQISYNKVFETLLHSHRNKMVQSLKRRRLSGMLNVISERKSKGMVTKGWRRLMTIRRCLDGFTGFERTKMQKRFHNAFLQATAMHLFRSDVDVDLARVMKQNGWESLKQQCLCMTPRRFGVSISLDASKQKKSNLSKENHECRVSLIYFFSFCSHLTYHLKHVLRRLPLLSRERRDRDFFNWP